MEESTNLVHLISTVPIALDSRDPDVIKVADYLLPYSTGLEVECNDKSSFDIRAIASIPHLIEHDCDSDEKRFRIPSGIKGLICLYYISLRLQENCTYTDSGIHYHVDCSDVFEKITSKVLTSCTPMILKELSTWGYKGTYNRKEVDFDTGHCWMRRQRTFKTLEIRIGEMTFDYALLFKRVVHVNSIVRDIKLEAIKEWDLIYNPLIRYSSDIQKILNNRNEKI